ncbi:hypothetical protein BTVI_33769 [Pitangus sulphuratus]|nr:hypothetical protein BTVI_33769 [Pitangus sulphuratus]
MSGGAKIPFNIIDTALSSLKNSQSFINSGMDIATKTALDLVESFNDEEDVSSMEKVMLEFAAMDRDLNNYIRAFEETVNQDSAWYWLPTGEQSGVYCERYPLSPAVLVIFSLPTRPFDYIHHSAHICISVKKFFCNIQSKPPLEQLEAISSGPIAYYLGEETNPYLTTDSFQVVVESDKVKREKPEIIPDLEKLVQEKLTAIESKNSDSDLKSNEKYMYFMDQLKEMKKQYHRLKTIDLQPVNEWSHTLQILEEERMAEKCQLDPTAWHKPKEWNEGILLGSQQSPLPADLNSQTCNLDPPNFFTFHLVKNAFALNENIFQYEFTFRHISDDDNETIEQIDEDIAVTRSQMNFICPITQMEMRRPVRNKVCGHSYEEEAIVEIIQSRKQKKKKVRCPKMGCSYDDVKRSDLVPDEALKRVIDSQNK